MNLVVFIEHKLNREVGPVCNQPSVAIVLCRRIRSKHNFTFKMAVVKAHSIVQIVNPLRHIVIISERKNYYESKEWQWFFTYGISSHKSLPPIPITTWYTPYSSSHSSWLILQNLCQEWWWAHSARSTSFSCTDKYNVHQCKYYPVSLTVVPIWDPGFLTYKQERFNVLL